MDSHGRDARDTIYTSCSSSSLVWPNWQRVGGGCLRLVFLIDLWVRAVFTGDLCRLAAVCTHPAFKEISCDNQFRDASYFETSVYAFPEAKRRTPWSWGYRSAVQIRRHSLPALCQVGWPRRFLRAGTPKINWRGRRRCFY